MKFDSGDVSDMEAAVPAPASSEEGGDGAEETEATSDAQNEEQFAVAEVVPPRATRARSKRTVVPVAEEEVPMPRRTSRTRRTGTMQKEEGQGQQQQGKNSLIYFDSIQFAGTAGFLTFFVCCLNQIWPLMWELQIGRAHV